MVLEQRYGKIDREFPAIVTAVVLASQIVVTLAASSTTGPWPIEQKHVSQLVQSNLVRDNWHAFSRCIFHLLRQSATSSK